MGNIQKAISFAVCALVRRLSLGIFIWQPLNSNSGYSYSCGLCIYVKLCGFMCTIVLLELELQPIVSMLGTKPWPSAKAVETL